MALSRRNVLVALGAVVGGGGALVGTGAFTTVSAERSVEVSTAGDASAFLSLQGDGEYVEDNSGTDGTLTINLGGPGNSGFNQNAITTLDGVVTITNNSQDDSDALVGVSTEDAGDADAGASATLLVTDDNGDNAAVVTFYVGETDTDSVGDGDTQTIGSGESAELDVEVDTRDSTLSDTDADSGELTIVASEP